MPRAAIIGLALLAPTAPAFAGAPAPIPHPVERAFWVPVVMVGQVTAIEKDAVEAAPYPNAPSKATYRVAVVKVKTNLAGAEGVTHLKVGFVPPTKPEPTAKRDRRERPLPELKEGQEALLFLEKHPDAGFHTYSYFTGPVDSKAPAYLAQVEAVRNALAAVADPAKALKAEKPQDRFDAAVALIAYYRRTHRTRDVEEVPIPAEESRLILKAVAEGDFSFDPQGARLNGFYAVYGLGISEADGWKAPSGKQNEQYHETMRKAFAAWLAGPGKDYRIKKVVPKKK